ncbi:hypothetical protein KIL84_020011 [Mauremys mutica]|uniref:Uncharacterized protein n=1 Tax=Mauremys mutica TaxID=74926 RepID=A0A9D3XWS9_9SAUR|nr:hypothetical protein KIL84_020011 [Mauremys mutica]
MCCSSTSRLLLTSAQLSQQSMSHPPKPGSSHTCLNKALVFRNEHVLYQLYSHFSIEGKKCIVGVDLSCSFTYYQGRNVYSHGYSSLLASLFLHTYVQVINNAAVTPSAPNKCVCLPL